MKKKILLFLVILSALMCVLAISVSASSQSYTTFDVTLTDGTQKTAYSPGSDQWEGRIYLAAKLYAEAPKDTEGTYEEIDWTTVKELDFTNAMLYIYDSGKDVWNEKAYGSNQNNTALCLYPNGVNKTTQLTSLEKVTTGKLVTLREGSFNGAPALKELIISNNLLYMHNNVFNKCTSLEKVICLPGSKLISINDSFTNCTSLTTVVLGAQMTTVGGNAFNGCTKLTSVTFLDEENSGINLTIKGGAFANCSSLSSIEFLPKNVVKLESGVFQNCTGLTSIYIPAHITYIGSDCFRGCKNITSIEFAPDCEIAKLYAHTFDSTQVTSVTLPNTVTATGQSIFSGSPLVTINFGASFQNFNASNASQPIGCNTDTLKYLFMPESFTADAIRNNIFTWGDTNSNETGKKLLNLTIFYTGTKEQAEAIVNKAQTGGTDGAVLNTYFATMQVISIEDYAKLSDSEKNAGVSGAPVRFIVYGYNKCDAFYKGEHNWTGNVSGGFTGAKYFSSYEIKDTCTTCLLNDIKETVGAIFVSRGFSRSEAPDKYEILADFAVNHDALNDYNSKVSEGERIVEYGLYAALCENVTDGNGFAEDTKKASVNYMEKTTKYDLFTMKVTGLDNYQATPFYITAYFKVGNGDYLYYNHASDTSSASVDNKLISQVSFS